MKFIVIVDANFLFLPGRFHIDFIEECKRIVPGTAEIVILQRVLAELERKNRYKPNRTFERELRVIKEYLDLHAVELQPDDLPNDLDVDTALLEYGTKIQSEEQTPVIATNDHELRQRARDAGIPQITLRNQSYLVFQN